MNPLFKKYIKTLNFNITNLFGEGMLNIDFKQLFLFFLFLFIIFKFKNLALRPFRKGKITLQNVIHVIFHSLYRRI